jgi:hypothetical protein
MHSDKLMKFGQLDVYKRLPLFLQYHQTNKHSDLTRAVANTIFQDLVTALEIAQPETIVFAEALKVSKNYVNASVSDALAAANVNFTPVTKIQVAALCLRMIRRFVLDRQTVSMTSFKETSLKQVVTDLLVSQDWFRALRDQVIQAWRNDGSPKFGLLYDQKELIISIVDGLMLYQHYGQKAILQT